MARPAAWLRAPQTAGSCGCAPRTGGTPITITASQVIARARNLAALANGIHDDVQRCAARIPDAEYAAWIGEYATDALIIDPFADPAIPIVVNPWAAWGELDGVEPKLLEWRKRVNAWCGLSVPVPAPTPDPTPSLPDVFEGSTKLLIGGAILLALVVAWKV